MPPIVESQEVEQDITPVVHEGDDALLYDADGRLTLEAETIGLFLNDVDWTDVFDDEDVAEHVERTVVFAREVEDPETGEVALEVFGEADPNATDEELDAFAQEIEEKAYGKGKKMRGKKMDYEDDDDEDDDDEDDDDADESTDDDESTDEGESQGTMPSGSSLAGAIQKGMAGTGGTQIMRVGYGKAATTGTTVGKGDRQHKPGPHKLDYSKYDGQMTYAYESEVHPDGTEWCDVPEGLGVYVIERVSGEAVVEHIDADDLMAMLPYFIDELDEDTLEDRARKAIFHDLTELDYDAMFPGLDGEDLEEAKKLFKRGDFRKKVFAKKGPGSPEHSQRMRQMLAMLAKGAIVRVGPGKGYKKGGYKYGKRKSGTPQGKKAYARHKIKKIGPIRKGIKTHKVLKTQKRVVKQMIHKNLGTKMPSPWTPPQDRPDLGLGSLYYAIKGRKKKKVAPGKAKKAVTKKKAKTKKPAKKKAPKKAAKKKGTAKGKGRGKSPLASHVEVGGATLHEDTREELTLVRPMGARSGPHLAGLVERQLTGGKAEHQEALNEDE